MRTVRVPRPAVLREIDPRRHAVIEASAGTGKTYTLEHLIVELVLEHHIPLEQILVVTFTDKATREMRERVRRKLRAILDATEDGEGEGGCWVIDPLARRRLNDALAVFDRAPISTIHAFCQRVLTESAFDCARLLRQEQVESREVFGRAFRDELRVELAHGAPLSAVLERALSAWGAARLESILYRWYAEQGEPEPRFDRVVAHDALCQLPTRMELGPTGLIGRLLGQGLRHPSPKKEVPALLMALAPVVEALRAGGSIYDALLSFWDWADADAPSKKTALAYLREHLRKAAERAPLLGPLAESVERIGRVASSGLHVLVAEMLPRIVARLTGHKSEKGHFDFDDMLRMLSSALDLDSGGVLVGELRRRYRIALVDEFQDTDAIQWNIFRTIFFDHAPDHRLIVIGDPKQAIYGFRNADVHTYHAARDAIAAQAGQIVPLTVSYRSRAPIVEAINRVLDDGFFSGVNAYPHPVTCGRPERDARGESGGPLPAITLLHFVGTPELRADLVRAALGERIASEITRLLDPRVQVSDEHGARALNPSDVHVLCRSRGDAESIGAALAAARIPHAFYKQEGLFQTEAARDAFVLLRAVEDPDERVRRLDAWLTPFFAVPLERLDECRDLPPDHPLIALLSRWRGLAEAQQWAALFRAMLEESGMVRRELFAGASERRLTDYQHIFEVLLDETHRGHRSLAQLVNRLSAFIEGRESPLGESGNVHRLESERKAVQILTMHKSKGLEAEVVFLAGGLSEPPGDRLEPHVFHDAGRRVAWIGDPPPGVKERLAREKREEAERLLYVAMTRARSALYVPYFGPPPPGAPVHAGAAYELTAAPAPSEDPRAQLSLMFEDPEAEAPRAVEDAEHEYELERLNGPYRVLNDRLAALVASSAVDDVLLSRVEVPVTPRAAPSVDLRVTLGAFRPPPELLAIGATDVERFRRLARAHAGFDVTSYTRMKSALGGYRAPEIAEETPEPSGGEALDAALPSVEADELPGGTAVGVFLHEALEHLDFALIASTADGAALIAHEPANALLIARARANGVDEKLVPAAADILVRAMRAPLVLADGATIDAGLCSVGRRVAELPFLHPIPERGHPTLADAPPGVDRAPLSIERGYIRGVIDLVIEHAGRYHVLDYKSDRLPSYAPDAVRAHVERNYLVQARLYTLGTLRALAIHDRDAYEARFGGLLYAFLRRMGEGGEGVWTLRPSWDDVLAWERALYDDMPWGYALPPRRSVAV